MTTMQHYHIKVSRNKFLSLLYYHISYIKHMFASGGIQYKEEEEPAKYYVHSKENKISLICLCNMLLFLWYLLLFWFCL